MCVPKSRECGSSRDACDKIISGVSSFPAFTDPSANSDQDIHHTHSFLFNFTRTICYPRHQLEPISIPHLHPYPFRCQYAERLCNPFSRWGSRRNRRNVCNIVSTLRTYIILSTKFTTKYSPLIFLSTRAAVETKKEQKVGSSSYFTFHVNSELKRRSVPLSPHTRLL